MQATADDLDLSPPDGGHWRGPLGAALVVHGLLVLALTWGVGWQRDTVVVAEAELWSRLPQMAAPRAVAPPEPEAPPAPAPKPAPKPAPAVERPPNRETDIALARQREQAEKEKARQLELQREAEAKRREQAQRERQERERQAREQAAKEKAAQEKLAREKAAREKAEAARQEAQLEAERRKNIERMLGQAGAMGGPNARGNATQSSGPSAGYAGKLVARIRPNIVFADVLVGNPRAEVEVRTLPDGTIVGSRLLKSSGHPAWDDAVLRAIERTAKLPQDENGRIPGTLILGFRPQD